MGSQSRAGSGADSVGSRNGEGSVGSRTLERTLWARGAGSGADSVESQTGAGSTAHSTLKAEPLKIRARLMYSSSDSLGCQ